MTVIEERKAKAGSQMVSEEDSVASGVAPREGSRKPALQRGPVHTAF